MGILAVIVLFAGVIIMLVGNIWILVNAFKESIWWGLGSLLIPFVILFYVFTRWALNKKPFLITIGGLILYIIGFVLGASAMPVQQ